MLEDHETEAHTSTSTSHTQIDGSAEAMAEAAACPATEDLKMSLNPKAKSFLNPQAKPFEMSFDPAAGSAVCTYGVPYAVCRGPPMCSGGVVCSSPYFRTVSGGQQALLALTGYCASASPYSLGALSAGAAPFDMPASMQAEPQAEELPQESQPAAAALLAFEPCEAFDGARPGCVPARARSHSGSSRNNAQLAMRCVAPLSVAVRWPSCVWCVPSFSRRMSELGYGIGVEKSAGGCEMVAGTWTHGQEEALGLRRGTGWAMAKRPCLLSRGRDPLAFVLLSYD
eukprot:5651014-Pleurochrysis_carterae.AAC.1